jgi:hypothetical protein
MNKIEQAKTLIREAMERGQRPALLCSFGKDSMALAHLIRDCAPPNAWSTHGFPIPVIYLRDPWFPWKHRFAEQTAASWAMEVHNFPPAAAGVKAKGHSGSEPERLELVSRYSLATDYLDIPKNTASPEDYPRRDYLCGLRDWILRPKTSLATFPFDVLFHGHKSSDVDPHEGPVPLRSNREKVNDRLELYFPLERWSDDDVWDYLEQNKIPFDRARYGDGRGELADTWMNPDWTHACTACIDPRSIEEKVFCPKIKSFVPNVGRKVLRLDGRPAYVQPVKTAEAN